MAGAIRCYLQVWLSFSLGTAFFGIELPDLHPYELVDEYMFSEEQVLQNVQNKVISRPWIQDFTDSKAKPVGTYQESGTLQVQAQINAPAKQHSRVLTWNANGDYSEGIDVNGNNTNYPTITNQGSNHQMQNTQQNQNNGNH